MRIITLYFDSYVNMYVYIYKYTITVATVSELIAVVATMRGVMVSGLDQSKAIIIAKRYANLNPSTLLSVCFELK